MDKKIKSEKGYKEALARKDKTAQAIKDTAKLSTTEHGKKAIKKAGEDYAKDAVGPGFKKGGKVTSKKKGKC